MDENKRYFVVNRDESEFYGYNKKGQVMFVLYTPWDIPMLWQTIEEAMVVVDLYGGFIRHMITPWQGMNEFQT